MQTLVIRIPDELAKALEDEAARLHLTKSEVARRRLSLPQPGGQTVSGFDLIADLVGSVSGGPSDMSSNKKAYLKSKSYGKSRTHR